MRGCVVEIVWEVIMSVVEYRVEEAAAYGVVKRVMSLPLSLYPSSNI